MANFTPSKKEPTEFNGGQQYVKGDGLQAATINNLIESQLYSQGQSDSAVSTADEALSKINQAIEGSVIPNGTYPDMTVGKATNATFAQDADCDGDGNNIVDTYVQKAGLDRLILVRDYPIGSPNVYVQFPDMPSPAERWAGTKWTIVSKMSGRTPIGSGHSGWGTAYTFGAYGGSPNAVVVEHSHLSFVNGEGSSFLYYGDAAQENSNQLQKILGAAYGSGDISTSGKLNTSYDGVSGTNRNMQPYIVINYWKRTG